MATREDEAGTRTKQTERHGHQKAISEQRPELTYIHRGGGNYVLSDGTKVRGKANLPAGAVAV